MTIYRGVPLTDIPQGHYRTILADPPWKFLTRSAKGLGKSPDKHYKTMTIDEIKALPVRDVCAPDAVLLMWIIDTHAELAFDVIRAWGFKYKTVGLYWAKTTQDGKSFPIGTGFWTRANPEHALQCTTPCRYCDDSGWFYGDPDLGPCGCGAGEQEVERNMLATRGHPKRQDAGVPRLMVSPRREHSRKPDETHERVERLVKGPYLEMFSRTDREGWDVWGDEAGSFTIQQQQRLTKIDRENMTLLGFGDDLDQIAAGLV